MRCTIFLALFLCGLTPAGHAASFDCAKASTAIEKTICADPALSQADERLAEAFASALSATLYPSVLRRDQARWLVERDKLSDVPTLREVYRIRVEALAKMAGAWRDTRKSVTSDSARKTCVLVPDPPLDSCEVVEFGAVADDPPLRYQLQTYKEDGRQIGSGAVVFAVSGDQLAPILAAADFYVHFFSPDVIASPAGRLLVLQGYLEGTGNLNAEQVFLFDKGQWREVNTASWLGDLGKHLPSGWGAWKGIYPDYEKFTAATPLWKSGDGNCCPTAGRADIKLGLVQQRLVIRDLAITRGEDAARRDR